MVSLAARQGRQLQRYSSTGGRLVVGCIPYKVDVNCSSSDLLRSMEVLVISSQKGYGMMFPKGGWESDETVKQAASREALEEAGVQGNVERRLGKWKYKSSTQAVNDGIMFPLNVKEELVHWPEMSVRHRRWVGLELHLIFCADFLLLFSIVLFFGTLVVALGLCRRSNGRMQASMDERGLGQISSAAFEFEAPQNVCFSIMIPSVKAY